MKKEVNLSYRDLIYSVLYRGQDIVTRNSRVKRLFVQSAEFDRSPLVSMRKTSWKNALREWEWFMSGSCCIRDLHESVRPWWEPWANEEGYVIGNYGWQFRGFVGCDFREVDQIQLLLDGIGNHPFSRRNVITTWNTADMTHPDCPITNCHGTVIQAFVEPDDSLHMYMYQRSVDVLCGLPHNWIQYWAFLLWLCHKTGKKPGVFHWQGGDVHIYETHFPLAEKIVAIDRMPRSPGLVYKPTSEDFKAEDFHLDGEYDPILSDRAEMVV